MEVVGYIVDQQGSILTVFSSGDKFITNTGVTVLVDFGESTVSFFTECIGQGTRIDDEYQLWDSLVSLAEVIEDK